MQGFPSGSWLIAITVGLLKIVNAEAESLRSGELRAAHIEKCARY